MYFAGHVGDRIDLRLFLVFGMVGSGFLIVVFGLLLLFWSVLGLFVSFSGVFVVFCGQLFCSGLMSFLFGFVWLCFVLAFVVFCGVCPSCLWLFYNIIFSKKVCTC